MSEIYLVGGTTPRTDLNNYVSANFYKENAIESMNKWKEWQGEYEDYHIDSIIVDDIEEYDKKVVRDYIDKVVEELERFAKDPCETEKYCKHAYDGFLENNGCEHCVAERAVEIVKAGGKNDD